MQRIGICLLALFIVLSVSLVGCGGEDGGATISTPIHMEMSTDNLHPKVGLSGFIFGTFLLLNAYLCIIFSIVMLVIKEKAIKKFVDTIRMVLQMLNPASAQGGKALGFLAMIENNDTRTQIGTVGLVAGIILAYLGAWIAM